MATRNLARTVIEVGRTKSSKEGRKRLRRRERRENRAFCYDAETVEDYDDLPSAPVNLRNGYEFEQDDKLGPARRWMDSRVGRPWNDVFSELSVKFRGRGIALSHVVDTHMLRWVDLGELDQWRRFYEYVVDDDGILQHGPGYGKARRRYARPVSAAEASKWAADRKVIERGKRLYWSAPDRWERPTWEGPKATFESHRQGPEFSAEDYAFWAGLTDWAKKQVSLAAYNLRD